MNMVKLCSKCEPLLQDPKLDTIGRLRTKLCPNCRLSVAVASLNLSKKEQRLVRKYGIDKAGKLR